MKMTRKPSLAPEGVDPFAQSVTIAGACNRVFRQLFLKKNSIGLIPSDGYNPQDNQSLEAIRWLTYMNETDQVHRGIQHARNGGEIRLPDIGKVDGYREDPVTNQKWVYEFHVSIEKTFLPFTILLASHLSFFLLCKGLLLPRTRPLHGGHHIQRQGRQSDGGSFRRHC